jgi:hypothetical protein
MFGVKSEDFWLQGVQALSEDFRSVILPIDKDISEYVFLLRKVAANGKWRKFEVGADAIASEKAGLVFPNLDDLPLLDDKTGAEFLEKRDAAGKVASELNRRR